VRAEGPPYRGALRMMAPGPNARDDVPPSPPPPSPNFSPGGGGAGLDASGSGLSAGGIAAAVIGALLGMALLVTALAYAMGARLLAEGHEARSVRGAGAACDGHARHELQLLGRQLWGESHGVEAGREPAREAEVGHNDATSCRDSSDQDCRHVATRATPSSSATPTSLPRRPTSTVR
jgi:hypothetical protein